MLNLKKVSLGLVLGSILSLGSTAYAADEQATKEDAVAMVKKGVAFIKETKDKEKAYEALSDKAGAFIKHDLYLVVYAMDGNVLAHGSNARMIGKNLLDLKDVDGKLFVKERVDMGKTQASFWQDYKFTDPTTRKISPKRMYCEKLDAINAVVCGGIYKK